MTPFYPVFFQLINRKPSLSKKHLVLSSSDPPFKNEMETYTSLASESQATDGNDMDHDSLLYNEIWGSYVALDDSRLNDGPLMFT